MHRFNKRLTLESLEAREVPSTVGTLDPLFGTGGKVVQGGKPYEAVAVQTDGKVVAVASQSNDFVVVRYNADGSLDNTFGTGGIKTIDFAGTDDQAFDVAVQADGKIVVVGSTLTATDGDDFAVARLNTDGSLDTSFSTDGKVNIDFLGGGSKDDVANAVAVAANGDIFLVGTATNAGGDNSFGVAKLKADGTPATTFGNNGHQFLGVFGGTDDHGEGIAIQSDGKVVVAGTVNTNGNDFAVARMDPTTGQLDTTFNTTGTKTVNFGGASDDQAFDVAVQADGKIVVVGNTDLVAAELDAAIVRLNSNGTLDTSFDTDGLKVLDLGSPGDGAEHVLVQADKIIVVGNTDGDMVVAQLNQSNGALDTAFGVNGLTALGVGSYQGNGGALAPDGKIVVAGRSNSSSDGVVARLIGNVTGGTGNGAPLVVGGAGNGTAKVFVPDAAGKYGNTPVSTLIPFPGFTGEVRTAVADVNGDGFQDTIVATGPGAAVRVAVVSGKDNVTLLLNPMDPFGDPNFKGGAFVTAADMDGDGKAEIVVSPDQGGGPRVSVYSVANGTATQRANFFGIDDPNFRGGARVAVGDINKDGVRDLVVGAGFLGGPRIAIWNGTSVFGTTPTRLVGDFFGFPGNDAVTLRNGAFVAAGDVNGDGFDDLILGGGPGGAPRVFVLNGQQVAAGNVGAAQAAPIANFFVAGNAADVGGVRVAAKDADGDNKADVVVGTSNGARVYLGKAFTTAAEPAAFQDIDPFTGAVLANGVFVG
ncbi:MAG TPA: FG-GAP-like repeat-containing protein, partial [Gemmataceae bacterium]|nr:FG-GAP-like repeat-containing protein [Gemmataceae bacterium]